MKTNKRGLIVLLALAAVAIVWSVVSTMIRQGGTEISAASECLSNEIAPITCSIIGAGSPLVYTATINVKTEKGNPVGYLIVAQNSLDAIVKSPATGTYAEIDVPEFLATTQKTAVVTTLGPATNKPIEIKVYSVVEDQNGVRETCSTPSSLVIECTGP